MHIAPIDLDAALDRNELRALRDEIEAGVEVQPDEVARRLGLTVEELAVWAAAWIMANARPREALN